MAETRHRLFGVGGEKTFAEWIADLKHRMPDAHAALVSSEHFDLLMAAPVVALSDDGDTLTFRLPDGSHELRVTGSKDASTTLADRVHALTFDPSPMVMGADKRMRRILDQALMKLRVRVRRARRFEFSDDFVRAAVQAATISPDVMRERIQFADLPFDHVWFEYDHDVRIDAQHALGTVRHPRKSSEGVSGYLCSRVSSDNPRAWTATYFMSGPDSGAIFGPTAYRVDLDGGLPFDAAEHLSRNNKSPALGWGYGVRAEEADRGEPTFAAIDELARRATPVMEPLFYARVYEADRVKRETVDSMYEKAVWEDRGSIRFLMAAIAMINLVPVRYVHAARTGSRRVRGKHVGYLGSSKVTIQAGKTQVHRVVERAFKNADPIRHARHEVRGHYRVYHRGTPEERVKWIDKHERGDATLGYVRHEYEVVSGARRRRSFRVPNIGA